MVYISPPKAGDPMKKGNLIPTILPVLDCKNPAGPLGVSRVKHTHYTARKNFTRNRAEMA